MRPREFIAAFGSGAAKMRMVFRVREYDKARGFRKYFWKATPVG